MCAKSQIELLSFPAPARGWWRLEPDFLSLPRLMDIFPGSFLDGGALASLSGVAGINSRGDLLDTTGGGGWIKEASSFRCSNKSLWYACITNKKSDYKKRIQVDKNLCSRILREDVRYQNKMKCTDSTWQCQGKKGRSHTWHVMIDANTVRARLC